MFFFRKYKYPYNKNVKIGFTADYEFNKKM